MLVHEKQACDALQAVAFDIHADNYASCLVVEPALTDYVTGSLVTDYNQVLNQLASAAITAVSCTDCKPLAHSHGACRRSLGLTALTADGGNASTP